MSMNLPRSYPDKLLDELARKVFYKALSKVDEELDKATPDLDKIGAYSDAAAGASTQIQADNETEDDGETF